MLDDGSTDDSLESIRAWGDKVKWFSQSNQGGNSARNILLRYAEGDWVQYLDADDYLLPEKIEEQIKSLSQEPQADVIYSPSIIEYWSENNHKKEKLPIPKPRDPWILLARWYLPQTGSPLWRKQAIIDVKGWKEEQPCCQEHELYLRLLMAGKDFVYSGEAGSVYRQWSEKTLCRRDKRQTYFQRLIIEDRMEEYLSVTGRLTGERQHAINQARFECARQIWLFDRVWARKVIGQVRSSESDFRPSGAAAPKNYQLMYGVLGFELAEMIASIKRTIASL